jgi:hypothetical protein
MKFALVALFLTAGAAQAAPVTCTTNVNHDPRLAHTDITITGVSRDRAEIRMVTAGGLAHFITAPRVFDAAEQVIGPEGVRYVNADERFDLTVIYQPIGGQTHATLVELVDGKKIEVPMVCSVALN